MMVVSEKRTPDFMKDSYEFMAEDSQMIEMEIYRCLDEGAYGDIRKLEKKWERYLIQISGFMEAEKKKQTHERQERLCLYYSGYIMALFQLGERFTRTQWEDQQITHIKTEYFNPAMEALFDHRSLKHGKLAEILDVSPSQLNQIIRDISACPIRMINKEKHSKYTIYSLTPRGKQYVKQRHEKRVSAPVAKAIDGISYFSYTKTAPDPKEDNSFKSLFESFLDQKPDDPFIAFNQVNTQRYKSLKQRFKNNYQYI